MVQLEVWKDPNDFLFILRMPGLIKLGYKHSESSFQGLDIPKYGFWWKSREMNFLQNTEKQQSSFKICWTQGNFAVLAKKLGSGIDGKNGYSPRPEGTQNDVFVRFGGEKFRKSKIFFPQICLFLGPIDGTNDIFWSGLLF